MTILKITFDARDDYALSYGRSRTPAVNTFSSVRRTDDVKLSETNPCLWNSTNFACGFCFHATTLTAEPSDQKRFDPFLSAISPPTRLRPRLQSICEFVLFKNTYASSGERYKPNRYSPIRPTSGPIPVFVHNATLRFEIVSSWLLRYPVMEGFLRTRTS